MEYVWFVAIGMLVGLVVGRFLVGNNFGIAGDMAFAVAGSLAFGVALGASGIASESGMGSRAAMAAMGAFLALFLRRVVKAF